MLLDYLVEISQTQEDCYTEKDVIHEIGLFLIAVSIENDFTDH